MKQLKFFFHFFFTLIIIIQLTQAKDRQNQISLIPLPSKVKVKKGEFVLSPSTTIWIDSDDERVHQVGIYLSKMIQPATAFKLTVQQVASGQKVKNGIYLTTRKAKKSLGEEGYYLEVKKNLVTLRANTAAGLFYGVQTIRQLLPVEIERQEKVKDKIDWKIPCVQIEDKPRYQWRGMHLDVCRHFMPKEFIKRYIDYIAMHKMNVFHWHLTEDQGWRIEIKKYPRLTKIGAWRKETLVGHYETTPQIFDGKPHGGFYTQEDIKEIVSYAKSRFVTIVPEIEMPGHALAALAAYPELSCTGGPFEVRTLWGIEENVYCAGKEETFEFLENVLSEVMELFPSKYIHIGGDECPKTRWKECPLCQERIKQEGLKDEHELQSYFIRRIEKFLNSHGRKLIGWDEILEGGLAPDATVMSWRGTAGGIAAARQHHDVIMTPGTHCYFDHYQGDPDFEPLAIGGFTPLEKVYSFEPTPEELTKDEARHILGAQGNVWTEYMATPKHVEYMVFPRIAALSEVLWSPAEKKDWADFCRRMDLQYKRYELLGINYSRSAFNAYPWSIVDTTKGTMRVEFRYQLKDPEIRYTLDGSNPGPQTKLYTKPFQLQNTAVVKVGIFKGDSLLGNIIERKFYVHKALSKKVKITSPEADLIHSQNLVKLTDGMKGTLRYRNGLWTEFSDMNIEAEINLGKVLSIQKINIGFLNNPIARIFWPATVEFLASKDGQNYQTVASFEVKNQEEAGGPKIKNIEKTFPKIEAQFVKIAFTKYQPSNQNSDKNNKRSRIFVDEIIVQ